MLDAAENGMVPRRHGEASESSTLKVPLLAERCSETMHMMLGGPIGAGAPPSLPKPNAGAGQSVVEIAVYL